jgi:hypothetical protein
MVQLNPVLLGSYEILYLAADAFSGISTAAENKYNTTIVVQARRIRFCSRVGLTCRALPVCRLGAVNP